MKNVIIYTRVSTEEQKSNFSLSAQKGRLEHYCKIRNYNIVSHYEENYSAKTFDRPEFKKMLKFIQDNKSAVDEVLFVKWDRFSRNAGEAHNMIKRLAKLNVAARASEQELDLTIPENKLVLAMYLMAPEVENDRRSLNTSSGMIKAKEEGKWVSGAPYGYSRSKTVKGMLVKNDKAELVLESFTMYSKGIYSKEEVRRTLRKKGLTLSKSAFSNMLSNIVYCGLIHIPEYAGKADQIVKGIHEGIISTELFDKVQRVMSAKAKVNSKPKTVQPELPLRGFLICPKCDGNLTGSPSQGNGGIYYYYHCQNGCSRIPAKQLNENFHNWLDNLSIKQEIMDLYIEVMRDIFKTNELDKDKEVAKLSIEISKKESLLSKALERYINGDISKNDYKLFNSSKTKELTDLQKRIQDLNSIDSSCDVYMSYGFFLLANLGQYYNEVSIEGKRKFLGSIFPEKLKIYGNSYRTNGENVLIDLLCTTGKTLPVANNEKASKNADLYRLVAPPGIEPRSKV